MNRQEWTEVARALAAVRAELVAKWPPKAGYMTNAVDVHDRKLIHFATIDGIDKSIRAVCRALKSRSSRFDAATFLRIAGLTK